MRFSSPQSGATAISVQQNPRPGAPEPANTVMFETMEAAAGLAAARKDANLHVTTIGCAPSASNLQDIKTGA